MDWLSFIIGAVALLLIQIVAAFVALRLCGKEFECFGAYPHKKAKCSKCNLEWECIVESDE